MIKAFGRFFCCFLRLAWLLAHLAWMLHRYNCDVRQEISMQNESFFESVKRNLNGEPGQPIVLGVCSTLAARLGQEVWLIRLAAIVLGVIYTFATLAGYILLGLFMAETSNRTKSLFEGLAIWFRETLDKIGNRVSEIFGEQPSNRDRHY
jgi:phage shock protein PspC (stress-responsive transcriptional regulator)